MITDESAENYLCIVDSKKKFDYNEITLAKVILVYRFACCKLG